MIKLKLVKKMSLSGIHLLLTYRCDMECDHCFVWGSPNQTGVMTLRDVKQLLAQCVELKTVNYISIEGGEPFLYYPVMIEAVREAVSNGFHVEVLSNAYWATCFEDAVKWLRPLAESRNTELSVSSDLYHGEEWITEHARNAVLAAKKLGIPVEVLAIKYPKPSPKCPQKIGGAKVGLYELMFKGRAAVKLVDLATVKKSWKEFTECPYEKLDSPERVHIDPFGHVHVCQGICIGNAWKTPLPRIFENYKVAKNPIVKALIEGGPTALVERFGLPHKDVYADACHLCYEARLMLKERFPQILCPPQIYGEGLKANRA